VIGHGNRGCPGSEELSVISVMIVDDDERMRGLLRELVAAAHGFELVAEAASGDGAVAAARKQQPMLALMDVRMPGMDGAEAARQMKRESPSTVVVLISADPSQAPDTHQSDAVAVVDKRDLRAATLGELWRAHGRRGPQNYEVWVVGRMGEVFINLLAPAAFRYEPPFTVLTAAVEPRELLEFLENVQALALPLARLRIASDTSAAPPDAIPRLYRSHRYELDFAGTPAGDALTQLAPEEVHHHLGRTVICNTLDASALAALLTRACRLELELLSLRIVA
jgi:CheY-like chemotaxis protein